MEQAERAAQWTENARYAETEYGFHFEEDEGGGSETSAQISSKGRSMKIQTIVMEIGRTETLLRCPFCGSEAELIEEDLSWVVQCDGCPAVMGMYSDRREALIDWNKRA